MQPEIMFAIIRGNGLVDEHVAFLTFTQETSVCVCYRFAINVKFFPALSFNL